MGQGEGTSFFMAQKKFTRNDEREKLFFSLLLIKELRQFILYQEYKN
jgi:hypothetical protein